MTFKSVASEIERTCAGESSRSKTMQVRAELQRADDEFVELALAEHGARVYVLPPLDYLVLHD